MLIRFAAIFTSMFMSISAFAESPAFNVLDELNPNDPNIEQILEEYDRVYEEGTGQSAFANEPFFGMFDLFSTSGCYRHECAVWVQVVKSTQTLYLYQNGQHVATWPVSTGLRGSTPNMDQHPNGRVYDAYTSTRWPGGDYNGLGNMPYAIFIRGGYAIHGTPQGNWKKLGREASHGCIRVHPENAYYLNRLVRQNGVRNVWITVQY